MAENKTPWTDAYLALPADGAVVLACYEEINGLRYVTAYYDTGLAEWFEPNGDFAPWPDWWMRIPALPALEHFDPS